MKYKATKSWYDDKSLLKRRLFFVFNRIITKLYRNPMRLFGKFIGVFLSKMPLLLSASIKDRIKLKAIMPPESLGVNIVVDREKDYSRAQFCNKERLTCDWIKKYYRKGDVIYDIGANVGAVSLISAMYLKKNCEIYSFEPLPTTYSMLFKNIMLNNCEKVITPLNLALSNDIRKEKLHLTSIDPGTSGHGLSGSVDNENKIVREINVLTHTLDQIINSYNINTPNHIKIDVDGHDYEVLLGGESILKNNSLKTIIIEKNKNANKVKLLLKNNGFSEIKLIDKNGRDYENMGFVRDNCV